MVSTRTSFAQVNAVVILTKRTENVFSALPAPFLDIYTTTQLYEHIL